MHRKALTNNYIMRVLTSKYLQKALLAYKSNLPRVVFYHLVSDEPLLPYYYKKTLFSTKSFNDQLLWLKSHRYKFITLEEAEYIVMNNEVATKTIAFTTDDGFKENYTTISPIFYKYNIKPTLFLIYNCLDNIDLMWNNKVHLIKNKVSAQKEFEICTDLSRKYNLRKDIKDIVLLSAHWPIGFKDEIANYAWMLARIAPLSDYLEESKPYLTIAQVKELVSLGYKVGSHSLSHPDFSKISDEEIKNEMINSKIMLEKMFDIDVKYFAYPYGIRAPKIIEKEIIQKGIYNLLFGTKSNLTNNKLNIIWERDKMEQDEQTSLFWFTILPIIRNSFLHPLHIYK